MTLQVRLVHALGDRLIDLPPRTFEAPLVIGRAPEADVQVPAPSVSRRHSLLYAHDGQWYIQDVNGGPRTRVNGKPAKEPTPVGRGDVIQLGTDPSPPTLTIDPYGLLAEADGHGDVGQENEAELVVERAVETNPAGPTRAARYPSPMIPAAPVASWPAVPQPTATRLPQPGAMVPQPPSVAATYGLPQPAGYAASEQAVADPADPGDDWMAAAAQEPGAKRYYVPKPQGMSPGMIGGMIFAAVVILGGASYWYYTRQKAADEQFKIAQAAEDQKKVVVQKQEKKNLFDMEDLKVKAKQASAVAADAAKPKVTAVDNAAAMDAGRQTEEWRKVEEAHSGSIPPIEAVVIFGEYSKQYPASPYAADVRKFTDDALDQIWWQHVSELATERKDLKAQITAKNSEIAQSQEADFKKTLQEEKGVLEEKLQVAEDKLKEMNFLSEEPPNLFEPALMNELRRARNPVTYDPWKEATEKRIKQTRGQKSVW